MMVQSNITSRRLLLLLVAAASIGALCSALGVMSQVTDTSSSEPQVVKRAENGQRAGFTLPKLFDFANYKRLFNKSYGSPVEELAREKMFLARAYRAFISAVKYRFNMVTNWLAINHFSDWTPEKLRKLDGRKGTLYSFKRDAPVEGPADAADASANVPVASREEIARQLEQAKQLKDEPGYKEIADQLESANSAARRRKREARPELRRQLTLDDLVHAPSRLEASEPQARVASNNPSYQPPELESQAMAAAAGETQDEQLEPAEASFISRLPGVGFISSVTNELTRRLAGPKPKGLKTNRVIVDEEDDDVEKQVEKVGKLANNDELLIDHRTSGCFFRVRDQGQCGSCFIFSTIALYEWMHCRDTGNLVAFSEQYPIDCGDRIGIDGCNGGQEREVGDFVRYYGLELRKNYPYNHQVNTCPYDQDEDPSVMGYLKAKDEQGMHTIGFRHLEKTLAESPVLLGFGQYDGFFEYGGGVDKPDGECDDDRGHAMLLVGMGREDGQDYWLFRNSYNTDWGENGYYKLSKESDCLMDGIGWTSKAQFKWKDSVTTNPNYKGDAILKKKHRKSSH